MRLDCTVACQCCLASGYAGRRRTVLSDAPKRVSVVAPGGPDDSTETASADRWVRAYVVVPIVASGVAVGLAAIDPMRTSLWPAQYAGVAGIVAGPVLVGWTVLAFVRAGETLSPVVQPDRLVTTGPLARTRNPLYLGVVTTVAGVALLTGSPVVGGYAVLLAVVYHGIVVRIEEPKLAAAFGDEYHAYCTIVPRWLPLGRDP